MVMTEERKDIICERMEKIAFIVSAFIYTFFLANVALMIYENYQHGKETQYTIMSSVEE